MATNNHTQNRCVAAGYINSRIKISVEGARQAENVENSIGFAPHIHGNLRQLSIAINKIVDRKSVV